MYLNYNFFSIGARPIRPLRELSAIYSVKRLLHNRYNGKKPMFLSRNYFYKVSKQKHISRRWNRRVGLLAYLMGKLVAILLAHQSMNEYYWTTLCRKRTLLDKLTPHTWVLVATKDGVEKSYFMSETAVEGIKIYLYC